MQVLGVKKGGDYWVVNKDFKFWCEYGDFVYSEDNKMVVVKPVNTPATYKQGPFYIDDESDYAWKLWIEKVAEIKSLNDIEIDKLLKAGEKSVVEDSGFDIVSTKIVRVDSEFKALYTYSKVDIFMEFRNCIGYICTSNNNMYSFFGNFKETDHRKNIRDIESFIDSIVRFDGFNIKDEESEEETENDDPYDSISNITFVKPSYRKSKTLQIGTISVKVPDHMDYITNSELRGETGAAEELREQYELVIASEGYKDSLLRHKDVPIGINLGDIQQKDELRQVWAAGSTKAKEVLKNSLKQLCLDDTGKEAPISIVTEDKEFLVLYSKSRESSDPSNYWVSYYAMIVHGVLMYGCNFFFNSKKSTKKNYEETVKEFLEKITPLSAKKSKEFQEKKAKETLGAFAGQNGRIDPFMVAQLYSEDIIFNNENEIIEKDGKKVMTGLQVNASSPHAGSIAKQIGNMSSDILQLSIFLEDNERLRIPKESVAPAILSATKNMPISGLTVFEFMAWHMIKLRDLGDNKYMALVDRDLIKGIPGFYGYLGEVIKTFRKYNDITGDFDVLAVSSINLDSPILEGIDVPVKDADEYHSMFLYMVKEKTDPTKDGVAKSKLSLEDFGVNVPESGAPNEDTAEIWDRDHLDEIHLIEMQISILEDSWEHEIEESNKEIVGDKPFTRKNDARIKKVVANTEKLMSETAKNIESCMERLDEIAGSMKETDEVLPDVIALIGRCFENLHLKYTVHTMQGMDQDIKYTIDKKYSNISSKWKRKYNKLPSVMLTKMNEELDGKKSELTSVKRKITNLQKKINVDESWLEENKKNYDETISEKEKTKDTFKEQKKEYDNKIKELKEKKNQFNEKKKELQAGLGEKKNKLKGLVKLLDSELHWADSEMYRISSMIKSRSDEKQLLLLEEQKQRAIAEKAFFFKNKKTAAADAALKKIQEIESVIKGLETDADNLREQRKKTEEKNKNEIDQQESLVDEMQKELQKMEDNLADTDKSLDDLESYMKKADSEIKKISEQIKGLKTELKEHQNRKKELDGEMEELSARRNQIEEEVKEITDKITEITGKNGELKYQKPTKKTEKKVDKQDKGIENEQHDEQEQDVEEIQTEEAEDFNDRDADDLEDTNTSRSNMFSLIESRFANGDFEEIKENTMQGGRELYEVLNSEYKEGTFTITLLTAAKIGISSESGSLNAQEKALVDAFFPLESESREELYNIVAMKPTDNDYKLVQSLIDCGNETAFPFLYVVLGFAYIDGKVNDRVMKRLDSMYGMSLLSLFIQSGLESVPAPTIRLEGLEAEIVRWFKSDDTLRPLKEIVEHFSDYSENDVKEALDSLCDKGIMYGGEDIVGCMYGLLDGE